MKVALYLRVSTSYQQKGLESQERALIEYCLRNNIGNYQIFKDFNVSGTKASRPALDEMLRQVECGKISSVVVYSFSRFARSTKHLISALEYFKQKNVSFVSLSENIDSSTAAGKMVFVMVSAIAEFERDLISERVKNGLKNARAKGKKIGRPKQRPSELIFKLREEGYSCRKIAKMINFSHTAVHRELKKLNSQQKEEGEG